MIVSKMKRTMKWHTEGYIDTDVVWEVAAKKALKNMDSDSLRRLLNEHFGLLPTQVDYMTTSLIWQELQRRKKEEKKMHKKQRVNGHVVHKLPKCENLYYTVEPENDRVAVYMLKYDEGSGEPHYYEYGRMHIHTEQLGRHGYLQEQINWLILRYSDIIPIRNYLEHEKLVTEDLYEHMHQATQKALNNTIFKEEKKMENKVKDLFKITMDGETQQTISIFDNGVDPAWFEFEYDPAFKVDGINSLLHYIESMGIGIPHIHTINGCFSHHKIRYVTKDVTKDILTMLKRLGVFGDVTKHTICIEDVPSGVTGKLHIRRGKFGFGVTRNEMAVNRGAVYYYIPEDRDPTVLEFKNGKYVRGCNYTNPTAKAKYVPVIFWNSIFGDDRFYETWGDVKKAVVEAINDRKIYVNVPCIPELREENCCIDE